MVEIREPYAHPVERPRQLCDLVLALAVDLHREVTAREPVCGHLEAPDPPREAQRGERADEPGTRRERPRPKSRMSRLTTATADNRSASGCVTSIVVGTGSEEFCGGTGGRATSANSWPALVTTACCTRPVAAGCL